MPGDVFISQKVFIKSLLKRQFPHKSVTLCFLLVITKDELKDSCGNLRNDFIKTFCEIRECLPPASLLGRVRWSGRVCRAGNNLNPAQLEGPDFSLKARAII